GQGCPDISLLKSLSELFGVDMEKLLAGELDENKKSAGNMRKMNFYICPACGNIITSLNDTTFSCCGKKLTAEKLQKAEEKLNVELIENEYYVTTSHPMTREHYISFVAVLTGDSLLIRKTYPEWDLQTRIPFFPRGRLIWYCTQHGLFYQNI
ncbi:MAG: XRE family transcriptional regulator, partial [Oscillospiraceae bacterium]|nr:XRE family transcriptional regulator [Oscillospiraceae bacterium]